VRLNFVFFTDSASELYGQWITNFRSEKLKEYSRRRKVNIQMDLEEIRLGDTEWINLGQVGPCGRFLQTRQRTFEYHKTWGLS
jgi:hypothetical protein